MARGLNMKIIDEGGIYNISSEQSFRYCMRQGVEGTTQSFNDHSIFYSW